MPETIQRIIEPRIRDLGGFEVMRVLPAPRQRLIGPFIFWDQMGPAHFASGSGIDVRPHPHIGLATVTYLFDGEIDHRDSLGFWQTIRPGDVNWMTAGRGIVHSERTGPDARKRGARIHGIQSWIALPLEAEETDPSFHHHPADTLPVIEGHGVKMRLIAGSAFGEASPVAVFSKMFYVDVLLDTGAKLDVEIDHEERAVYVVEGELIISGAVLKPGRLAVLEPKVPATIEAPSGAHVMLLGGESLSGERHIWWNFVSSSKKRIDRAKDDWKNKRFQAVPGEMEFIPLPDYWK